jgi:hypothetical protein
MSSFRSHSPYSCTKIVNEQLTERGLTTIPPQMMYTYVAKGYIASFINDAGKRVVSELDLANWFEVYVAKKAALANIT